MPRSQRRRDIAPWQIGKQDAHVLRVRQRAHRRPRADQNGERKKLRAWNRRVLNFQLDVQSEDQFDATDIGCQCRVEFVLRNLDLAVVDDVATDVGRNRDIQKLGDPPLVARRDRAFGGFPRATQCLADNLGTRCDDNFEAPCVSHRSRRRPAFGRPFS